MPLFLANYKVFDDKRSDAATLFASMDEKAHEADIGPNYKIHGRWHDAGHTAGMLISEAPDAKTLFGHIFNWAEEFMDVDVKPICNDNTAREILLKGRIPWTASYENIGDEAGEGESLYLKTYQIHPEHKAAAYSYFASLTENEEKAILGPCRMLGRYHDLASGSGVSVIAAKSEKDVYAYAYSNACFGNRILMNMKIVPVLTDKAFSDVIKGKPGFDRKLTRLMAKEK